MNGHGPAPRAIASASARAIGAFGLTEPDDGDVINGRSLTGLTAIAP
jgi:hypothetical protein